MSTHHSRIVTAWAAATLSKYGATLHAIRRGWDVELPDGAWRTADDWRELARIARFVRQHCAQLDGDEPQGYRPDLAAMLHR